MPVDVALCGLGSAALRAHLPALCRAEEAGAARVVAVCDPDTARRTAIAERIPGAACFPDAPTLLGAIRPDLLVVASPPSAHLEAIRPAAALGVNVLCEKPLGLSDDDVAVLEDTASSHPRLLLATVLQYRHAEAWRLLLAAARAAARAGRRLHLQVEVERPGTDPLSAGGWRAQGERQGGILGDHAVHYLSLCHRLDPAARVVAASRSGEPGREVARVDLELTAGTAAVDVSYAGTARRNLVAVQVPDDGFEVRWADASLVVERGGRRGTERTVGALSDRQYVNALYAAQYDEVLGRFGDPAWRAAATAETIAVARLLAAALDATAAT